MRSLPRLSASQAVNNFKDIYSEKNGKYRHISHADFNKSHEMLRKKKEGGQRSFAGYPTNEESNSKFIESSNGYPMTSNNDQYFSPVTPVGLKSEGRKMRAKFTNTA